MTYQITKYTTEKAKALGLTIKPSTNPSKKLDVYKNGVKLASCGAVGYADYPTYLKSRGLKYANERRKLYKQRHEHDRKIINSPGYFADKLLW